MQRDSDGARERAPKARGEGGGEEQLQAVAARAEARDPHSDAAQYRRLPDALHEGPRQIQARRDLHHLEVRPPPPPHCLSRPHSPISQYPPHPFDSFSSS